MGTFEIISGIIVLLVIVFSRRFFMAKSYHVLAKNHLVDIRVEPCSCAYAGHRIGDCYRVIQKGVDTGIVLHMGFKVERGALDYTAKCKIMVTRRNELWKGSSLHWGAESAGDQPDMVIEGGIGERTALIAATRVLSTPKWEVMPDEGVFYFRSSEIIKDSSWPALFDRLLSIKSKAMRADEPEEVEFYIKQYLSVLSGKEDVSNTLPGIQAYKYYLESN